MTKTALITGASAGIGLELAKLFAQDGYQLVLVARRQDALQKLAQELHQAYSCKAHVFTADLSLATAPGAIYEFTKDQNIHVDVLVNNAGFGANGAFAELPAQTQVDIVQVNITSLVLLSRLFLPAMLDRHSGGILNVGSTAAFAPGPFMAVYYATKAFVVSLSEALANETEGTGVRISCLCPGPTITEFQSVAKLQQSKLFESKLIMDAATVAKLGFDGFNQNKGTVICGTTNQLGVLASRLVPRKILANITRKLQEPVSHI